MRHESAVLEAAAMSLGDGPERVRALFMIMPGADLSLGTIHGLRGWLRCQVGEHVDLTITPADLLSMRAIRDHHLVAFVFTQQAYVAKSRCSGLAEDIYVPLAFA